MTKWGNIKFLIFFLISMVGFATGMNFLQYINISAIQSVKGCFEFGFFQVLQNKNLFIVLLRIFLSSLKYFVLFIISAFSWWLYPIAPITNFLSGFKMGVSTSFILSIMGIVNIIDSFFTILLTIGVLTFLSYVSKNILNQRIYHLKYFKLDTIDEKFFVENLLLFIAFSFFIFLYFLLLKITPSRLFGLIETFL